MIFLILIVWAIGVPISIIIRVRTPTKHWGGYIESNAEAGFAHFLLGLTWPWFLILSFFSMLGSNTKYELTCKECMGSQGDSGIGGRLAACKECNGNGSVIRRGIEEANKYSAEYYAKKKAIEVM